MKKASILSFQFANNFGAILQIYGLSETLKQFDLDVEIIDYKPLELTDSHNLFMNIPYNVKNKGINNTIKKSAYNIVSVKRRYERIKNFNSFKKNYLKLTDKTYQSNEDLHTIEKNYDYYFVGSDQVWNPYFMKFTGNSYFLDFANSNSRKISYAASIAETTDDREILNLFKENLKRFDSISVREKSAKEMIQNLTDKEISVTLDPTLLLTKNEWLKITDTDLNYDKFILVYDLEKSDTIVNLANYLSKKTGYKIVTHSRGKGYINHYFSYLNNSLNEFLGLFNAAEIILTSSFHGTVFATIFEKEFYTIPHSTRSSRMVDFLKSINLEDRMVSDFEENKLNTKRIDYSEPNNKLSAMREESISFIRNSL